MDVPKLIIMSPVILTDPHCCPVPTLKVIYCTVPNSASVVSNSQSLSKVIGILTSFSPLPEPVIVIYSPLDVQIASVPISKEPTLEPSLKYAISSTYISVTKLQLGHSHFIFKSPAPLLSKYTLAKITYSPFKYSSPLFITFIFLL